MYDFNPNPELLIKRYVALHGESDGICLIHWLPDFFNGVVKNMGKATDILGAYYSPEDGSLSFSVQDKDDTCTLFPVSFCDFDDHTRALLTDYFNNLAMGLVYDNEGNVYDQLGNLVQEATLA